MRAQPAPGPTALLPSQEGKGRQVKANHYRQRGYAPVPAEVTTDVSLSAGTHALIGETIIERGASLSLAPGAIMFCEPGAVVRVRGVLRALGSQSRPIRFSVMPAEDVYVLLSDGERRWRGIIAEESARVTLQHATIEDAMAGVIAQAPCDSVTIAHTRFPRDEFDALHVENRSIPVTNGQPFTLVCEEHFPAAAKKQTTSRGPLALSISFGALAAGGVVAGLLLENAVLDNIEKTNDAVESAAARDYYDTAKRLESVRNAVWIASGAACAGGLVSLIVYFR
jgi:hypothetical protein